MLTKLRPRSAYDVMAALSLFIVLGGSSYALSTGAIDSREIKNNSIRGKDIRRGAVKSSDVKNQSLRAKDFKAGELPAGPVGPQGATGARGATGPRGPAGTARAYGRVSGSGVISRSKNATASIVPGQVGRYCIRSTVSGVTSANTPIIVSVDRVNTMEGSATHVGSGAADPLTGSSSIQTAVEASGTSAPDCPSGQWEVFIFEQATFAGENSSTVEASYSPFTFVIP